MLTPDVAHSATGSAFNILHSTFFFEAVVNSPRVTAFKASRSETALTALFLVIASLAPIHSIKSYDYFWHLATGRWIVEHRVLPLMDPFGVASARIPWINGEWLFEIGLYAVWAAVGHAGVALLRALWVGALFTLVLLLTSRRAPFATALVVTAVCWYGGAAFLTERPGTVAVLLAVISIEFLQREVTAPRTAAYVAITVLWFNIHPSGLIAPALAGISAVGRAIEVEPGMRVRAFVERAIVSAIAAVALLVNPYAIRGVIAPLKLVHTIRSGNFVNLEWMAPTPSLFPLLFATAAAGLIVFLASADRRQHATRFLLFAFFAFLAMRFLRNQTFYYAIFPLVVAPIIVPPRESVRKILVLASFAFLVAIAATRSHATGVDREKFPVAAVGQLEAMNARGNILNDDELGGYLIWTYYPERRVLNDGRNELYTRFIDQYGRAKVDSRRWRSLLAEYDVALAVVNYTFPTVDVVDSETRARRPVAKSTVFFPRTEWALVAFDDAAMVLAKRDRWTGPDLSTVEYRVLLPEDLAPRFAAADRVAARQEIERAFRRGSDGAVLRKLAAAAR